MPRTAEKHSTKSTYSCFISLHKQELSDYKRRKPVRNVSLAPDRLLRKRIISFSLFFSFFLFFARRKSLARCNFTEQSTGRVNRRKIKRERFFTVIKTVLSEESGKASLERLWAEIDSRRLLSEWGRRQIMLLHMFKCRLTTSFLLQFLSIQTSFKNNLQISLIQFSYNESQKVISTKFSRLYRIHRLLHSKKNRTKQSLWIERKAAIQRKKKRIEAQLERFLIDLIRKKRKEDFSVSLVRVIKSLSWLVQTLKFLNSSDSQHFSRLINNS